MEHPIRAVQQDSIAGELGIEPGDILLSINSRPLRDILDYKSFMAEENLLLLVKRDDVLYEYDVEKEAGEDVGLKFPRATLDKIKKCRNRCIFCFIDQLPPGLRPSLYLKDDDYRLSLLHGNYISLTNLSPAEVRRILKERISPLYISIHTTDPDLRQKMMGTPRARPILEILEALKAGGIGFHGQIVLCPGVNDEEELDKTLGDLAGLVPNLLSLSLVPVGLTGHREGLYPLRPFEPEESRQVIAQAARRQAGFRGKQGMGLVYAADEFYLSAGLPLPPAGEYDGYPQLENGVGLVRLLLEDYREHRRGLPRRLPEETAVSIACSTLAAPVLAPLAAELDTVENLSVRLFPVANRFFGGGVTVTGLLTGSDLIEGLSGRDLGDELFIDDVMLKDGGDLFLDGLRVPEVREALKVRITPVEDICRFIEEIRAKGQGKEGSACQTP